jgi:hypothetical protein
MEAVDTYGAGAAQSDFPSLQSSASLARTNSKGAAKVARSWQLVPEPEPSDDWEILGATPEKTVWDRKKEQSGTPNRK